MDRQNDRVWRLFDVSTVKHGLVNLVKDCEILEDCSGECDCQD